MNEFDSNGKLDGRPADEAPGEERPGDLERALNDAVASERYVVAVWHVAHGRIHLFRETSGFPLADLSEAERLLHDDFLSVQSPHFGGSGE